jgi:glycosyltransferase involved in cell wall biosynthesis
MLHKLGQGMKRRQPACQKPGTDRVLLAIYTHPEWHSTFIFSSQMLCEHGFDVDIVCKDTDKRSFLGPVDFGSRARVHVVKSTASPLSTRLDYLAFLLRVAYLVRRRQPVCVIGYDLFGFAAACLAAPRTHRIYHNFDITEARSRTLQALKVIENSEARRADLVVASSPGRARILQDQARLRTTPTVVMNCQRMQIIEERTGELHRLLPAHGVRASRIVLRLGSLGPGHGIEATIKSVLHWNRDDWVLVLAGSGGDPFLQNMHALVEDLHLQSRVVFLPRISRDLWYDCLYSADLGIGLYEAGNINHASMAGAGNKLNLYLKAGIPSVVSALPDFEAFARRYGACEAAVPNDPSSVAEAVNTILSNEEGYQRYCREASHAFKNEYHFEQQFRPVLDMLLRTSGAVRGDLAIHE